MVWFLGSAYMVNAGILVALILLQSGRGGGLSDMFGGGMSSAASGSTTMERNLTRMTIIFVLIFGFLTLSMSFILS
jgi:preprotein translocase subunit SecG